VIGAVLIRGTPFALRVPTTRVRPSDSDETIWFSMPDHIENDDVVTDWLVMPPNLERLSAEDQVTLKEDICEIAGHLRFVHNNLIGVRCSDDRLSGFRRGIVLHLEQASELILRGDDESVQKAWWELQMSVESALKGLTVQKTGTHPFSHKIPVLFDAAEPAGLSFNRSRFDNWPDQTEMSSLRYAQGTRRDVTSAATAYRLVLALAAAAVEAMDGLSVGKARFKIGQPPWLQDEASE
jgi:hypothetical protein